MKIPLAPPSFESIFEDQFRKGGKASIIIKSNMSATTIKGDYQHWDKLRHLQPPEGLTSEQWWLSTKLARRALYKSLPFLNKQGIKFVFATPDSILQKLHSIDRQTGNNIQSSINFINSNTRDTYLVRSLVEESITSSQLEGASTTRKVAKEMIRTSRKPRNKSEQMIYNNYQAMQFIREIKDEKLTIKIILELHRILTKDTLEDSQAAGYLRKPTDEIHVWDNTDQILHTPPSADELEDRLEKLCLFANTSVDNEKYFIHPVIKAILLHFMLAYDHPFIDGNGRTARALFYWSMLHQGYWLMEFISISSIIKKAPVQYARAYLYTETDDNDATYFIDHQLDVIIRAIDELDKYLHQQNQEINETEKLLNASDKLRDKLNYRQIALIKHALKHPNMHYLIEAHKQAHNVTYDTARTDLLKLVKLKLLSKKKIGKAFVFIAQEDLKKMILNLKY